MMLTYEYNWDEVWIHLCICHIVFHEHLVYKHIVHPFYCRSSWLNLLDYIHNLHIKIDLENFVQAYYIFHFQTYSFLRSLGIRSENQCIRCILILELHICNDTGHWHRILWSRIHPDCNCNPLEYKNSRKNKSKLLFIPMGGLRAWVWVAESTRRARTTEVFILRTNRPLIHSSRCQPYLYPSTIIKVKIQFLVNVYRVWKQGLENQSGYFI